jgi:hypothetical protein
VTSDNYGQEVPIVIQKKLINMLARLTSNSARSRGQQSLRSFATLEKSSERAIGSDGRHEIWRGDVDHDNEPKVCEPRLPWCC